MKKNILIGLDHAVRLSPYMLVINWIRRFFHWRSVTLTSKFFKFSILLSLIISGGFIQAQYFNDSIVIPAGNRNFYWWSASNDFLFVSDQVNDSIYVISFATQSIVASKKAHANAGRIKYANNKIILNNDNYSVEMYNASNIYNITYLQTLGGFNQGWMESDPDDTTYFYWIEHWAQKIRIIDFSSGIMIVKSNPSTSGNLQSASRIANMLYTGNAYNNSKRMDITNPSAPVVTAFGGPAVKVQCTDQYILYENYFYGHVVSLLNQSGSIIASKTPASLGLGTVTRDNFVFLSESGIWKLYTIQNGSFDFIINVPREIQSFNNNFWIGSSSSKIVLYPRNVPTIQAVNVTFSDFQNNQFTFNWTDGNGSKRIVFIKQDSVGTAAPIISTAYTSDTVFGAGSQIGTSGWYCVFNGTTHDSGVTVTNLLPDTKYRVMVCEYNGTPGNEQYNKSLATGNPENQKTCSIANPTISGSAIACQGITNTIYATEHNMTGYIWNISEGGEITAGAGTDSISATWTAFGDQWVSVTFSSESGCTAPSPAVLNVTVHTPPDAAGTITGPATVFKGQTGVSYSIAPLANATGYVWNLPSGATITSGENTANIVVSFSATATSGNMNVRGTNTCGNGTVSPDLFITVTQAVPPTRTLTNMIVPGGQTSCYDATQTITV
ncbi:MAG: hypothetical protein WCI71_13855, partial [Bacteroidota bacterium]